MKATVKFRTSILFFIFFCTYIILFIHFFNIQILCHTFYQKHAEQQYTTHITQFSPRALIYDRNGNPLATNNEVISAFIMPKNISPHDPFIHFLHTHYPIAYQKYLAHRHNTFLYLERNIPEHRLKHTLSTHYWPQIKWLKEPKRFYPYPFLAHIVGVTDIDDNGISGIEQLFDTTLRGNPTLYTLKKEARSHYFYFEKHMQQEGNPGTPVTLTIDSVLQNLIQKELVDAIQHHQAHEGGVLIMNPDNGDILVMAQYPTFNSYKITRDDIALLNSSALTNAFEPGSVVKIFLALAALEEGITTPDELIDCENKKEALINGIRVTTVIPHGIINFSEIIQGSNNIGTVKVAQRLGELLYDHYQRVGFGKKTNISLNGERSGFINPPYRWSKYSLNSLSFGYEITITLIQLAQAFSVLVHNGCLVKPRILIDTPLSISQQLYRPEIIYALRKILKDTVASGTAYRAALPGYTILGKTGTANLVINGTYDSSYNRFIFVGSVERDAYKRIIVAFLSHTHAKNLYASQTVAPLFRKIAERLVIHEQVI